MCLFIVVVYLLESLIFFSCFFLKKNIIKVVNVHGIRENSIISLHLPVILIQLLLAYG